MLNRTTKLLGLLLSVLVICSAVILAGATTTPTLVAVRHPEGLLHGFLVLRTLTGETLAHGDLIQGVHGDRVTSRLIFHFKDGSLYDETAIFSQHNTFRLLSDHQVLKGPAFQRQMEVSVNGSTGNVSVQYTDDGKEKVATEHFTATPDLANGVLFTLLKNLGPGVSETKASLVAFTPKPRLVKLAITSQGEEPFSIGDGSRKAMHYVIKVEIGGLAGLIAPMLGKEPPETHVWILGGEAPAFLKSEGPLYSGGPVWRIELTSPVWPRSSEAKVKVMP
jgi:hypothetical protein